MDILKDVSAAFNESTNYFTWAFYSMAAGYIVMSISSRNAFRCNLFDKVATVLFIVFALVSLPNLASIIVVFSQKLGLFGGLIGGLIAVAIILSNVAIFIVDYFEEVIEEVIEEDKPNEEKTE